MTNSFDIQLIDDQPENLTVLRKMLSAQGYRVRASITGEMALTSAFESPPDLILLDIVMPGLDGFEVCRHLKADERTRDIPVLFLSGRTEIEQKIKAFTVGGVDYITKPFQQDEVLARVATHLALRNAKKQLEAQNIQLQQINQKLSQEITERKQAEATLRESEARYRQIFQTNLAVKLIINPADGRIIAANDAACQFYGYDIQTLTSLRITDINILSGEEVQQEMERAKTQERLFFNFRHRLASGEIRDVEVYSGPLQSEGETLLYSIIHDVTERKKIEKQLQNQARLFQQVSEAIIATDKDLKIISWNEAATKIYGWHKAEAMGQTIDILLKTRWTGEPQLVAQQILTEIGLWQGEIMQQHKAGHWLEIWASVSFVQDYEGNIEGGVTVNRDITKRKQAVQALQAKNEELQAALNHVKQLSGLLPICANCKKIRDDEGYWQDVAVYIRDHSEVEFSHGICPGCAKALYPEFYKSDRGGVNHKK